MCKNESFGSRSYFSVSELGANDSSDIEDFSRCRHPEVFLVDLSVDGKQLCNAEHTLQTTKNLSHKEYENRNLMMINKIRSRYRENLGKSKYASSLLITTPLSQAFFIGKFQFYLEQSWLFYFIIYLLHLISLLYWYYVYTSISFLYSGLMAFNTIS